MNVFKQLLKKEFGRESYDQYVMSYQKLLEKRSDQKQLYNQEVFSDIYDKLKGCDAKSLQERAKRLLDAMYSSMNITNYLWLRSICCIMAVIILLSLELTGMVTAVSVTLIAGCFVYSIVEYAVNRFCFIDAHIIIVYKSVLDALLLAKGVRHG